MTQFSELLQIAKQAAIEAGFKVLEIYHSNFEVVYKEDESPLTLADKLANQVIMSYLLPTDIPIISEENKQISYSERKQWNRFWLVDPLDGTKEFVQKNDEFTINIALIDNGVPVMGVIYVPVKKELYFNTQEASFKIENITCLNDLHQNSNIRLNAKSPEEKLVVATSRSHLSANTASFIQKLKTTQAATSIETIAAGSSIKLCMLAEGKADLYPRFSPTMEWDIAAGHAICRMVGVKVVEVENQKELSYNQERLVNPSFVAGKPSMLNSIFKS